MPVLEELFKVRVSSKGQVVIPKPLREAYGISRNSEIIMIPLEEGILIRPAGKVRPRLRGLLRDLDVDVAECGAILAEAKRALLKGI